MTLIYQLQTDFLQGFATIKPLEKTLLKTLQSTLTLILYRMWTMLFLDLAVMKLDCIASCIIPG